MKIESFIRILAGTMILVSVALAHFVSVWWLLFTCFIGLNLIQSALTGFCPPSFILRKLGWLDEAGTIHWGGR
jgi:hypothetical protein